MAYSKKFFLILFIVASCFEARGADKYTDENRPYEFGFSIDGEQHRHEKKDENGIIMGEFGFITADGVYHVTVYATDENGNFKIISMKNIRVKPYPTSSANDARTGHSLSFPPQVSASKPSASLPQSPASYSSKSTSSPEITSKPASEIPIIEPPRACSSCSLPTTTTIKPVYYESNVGGISPNTQNGFSSPGADNYGSNNANTNRVTSNSQASQLNKINSGNSPASSPVIGNSGPNNSQQPLGDIPLNYNNPISSSRFNQLQPNTNAEQNYNQNPIGSTPIQPSQGTNPQQFNPNQNSGNDNLRQEFGGGPYTNSGNVGSNTDSDNTPQNYNQNAIGSTLLQPSQETNPQQFNSNQNSGNDNLRQQFGGGPNTNSVNYGSNNDNKNALQNDISNPGSKYNRDDLSGERNPKQLGSSSQTQGGRGQNEAGNFGASNLGKPEKPVLISAQMQIVDKNTDINYKKPGEKDGLPNGLTKSDMENLLYTFNYTLAFQGHYEEGYTNGAKQGYYFVTGRNGVRTRVDYVADENGFRPKITQEVLDLISDDVPKPETEKDEKFGLRGYEFKWLYFPVGSNQR